MHSCPNHQTNIAKHLEDLREEYRTANNARRHEIVSEASYLKKTVTDKYGCYECKNCPPAEKEFPYCSRECHEVAAKNNYDDRSLPRWKRKLEVDEIKRGLMELSKRQEKMI